MRIGFIGAGKVGSSFGALLKLKGQEISGYYSRSQKSIEHACEITGSTPYSTLEAVIKDSDWIGITVQDDQIEQVVAEITSLPQYRQLCQSKTFFHMSGATTVDVLKPLKTDIFSLHPLMAFPSYKTQLEDWSNTFITVENPNAYVRSWLPKLGLSTLEIESSQKVKYHTAAVVASNYLVTLMDFAINELEFIGIDRENGFKALLPLVEGTLNNIQALGTKKAITGPIVRGDVKTVKSHLEALEPEPKELYRLLGRHTLQLISEANPMMVHLLEEDDACQK